MVFEKKRVVAQSPVTSMQRTVYVLLIVIITCERMTSVKKYVITRNVPGTTIHVTLQLRKIQHTYMWRETLSKMMFPEKELSLTLIEV